MTTQGKDPSLEARIDDWRAYLRRHGSIHSTDVAELEDHLRERIDGFLAAGLDPDEAFLIAVKRMGALDALSQEFAREHSERLWKQLVVSSPRDDEAVKGERREAWVALLLAVAAGVCVKLPALLGFEPAEGIDVFYARNASLFVLPLLTGFFLWKRSTEPRGWAAPILAFLASALVVNLFPFQPEGSTLVLTILHLPIALWLVVGIAYAGGRWGESEIRMDFVRFTGELFIYYALFALGGGVLTGFTLAIFASIGVNVEWLAQEWIIPCGAAGAVLVAAWLVEAKQSVVENMAPVLARTFTPLFTLILVGFLITMVWTGRGIDVEREVLIAFDLLLVVVLGLFLYSISARDPLAPPDGFDIMLLVLVVSALLVDVFALAAIAARITDFGFTPNRVAALGENILLMVNLSWSAWLSFRFVRGKGEFGALVRWQTGFLPVFAIWAALVAVVFPPLFGWR